jgi:hypothetical protein
VLRAAALADPGRWAERERALRAEIGLPPAVALARLRGAPAEHHVAQLPSTVSVVGPVDGEWLVRAPDHLTLLDALASVARPAGGRLRIEVDPLRA